MIDVKKTITSSIKYYLMKLMKLGDNNLKVFKIIIQNYSSNFLKLKAS